MKKLLIGLLMLGSMSSFGQSNVKNTETSKDGENFIREILESSGKCDGIEVGYGELDRVERILENNKDSSISELAVLLLDTCTNEYRYQILARKILERRDKKSLEVAYKIYKEERVKYLKAINLKNNNYSGKFFLIYRSLEVITFLGSKIDLKNIESNRAKLKLNLTNSRLYFAETYILIKREVLWDLRDFEIKFIKKTYDSIGDKDLKYYKHKIYYPSLDGPYTEELGHRDFHSDCENRIYQLGDWIVKLAGLNTGMSNGARDLLQINMIRFYAFMTHPSSG